VFLGLKVWSIGDDHFSIGLAGSGCLCAALGKPKQIPADAVRLAVDLGHRAQINSVAFSPDGSWVLTGGKDQTARIWDLATGHEIDR
jgi:WD40 repeat protein